MEKRNSYSILFKRVDRCNKGDVFEVVKGLVGHIIDNLFYVVESSDREITVNIKDIDENGKLVYTVRNKNSVRGRKK